MKGAQREIYQGINVQSQSELQKAKYIHKKLHPDNIVINRNFVMICYAINTDTKGKSHIAIFKVDVLFYIFSDVVQLSQSLHILANNWYSHSF